MPKPKKAGRPPLPKGTAKVGYLRVRVTPDEMKTIEAAAKANKMTVSEWIRRTLLSSGQSQ
jgi:predicted HicB family RNase H-like nuclease